MITPSFIGIGAQKCATTWLFDLLELRPDVALSSVKEIHFFSLYFGYGYKWYESHFPEGTAQANAVGEFSTSYFSDLAAPQRIKDKYPDVKLIVALRNPIDRLMSNHKHEIRIGHLQGGDTTVESGIKNNPTYVDQGMYATHLKRWYKHFDKEQILVINYDDVRSDAQTVEQTLYQFLGLTSVSNFDNLEKSNPSYVYRSAAIEKIRSGAFDFMHALGLEKAWDIARKTGLQKLYRSMNRAPSEQVVPPMKAETRQELYALFEPEIVELESMTGMDLSSWKQNA